MKLSIRICLLVLMVCLATQADAEKWQHYRHRAYYEHAILPTSCMRAAHLGGPCGCIASIDFFGHSIPDLWKAWNWALKFPRTFAHAGTAAVQRHHVVQVLAVKGNKFKANDSWGIHWESTRGFIFVDPWGRR